MKENNIICNPITGICCVVDDDMEYSELNTTKEKIDVYYFTDPLCSHCYAIEPIFLKFKYMYSEYINVNIILGGLLESWDDFKDESRNINSHLDVFNHWNEMKNQILYPIDGSLWFNDPITSSYPASYVYEVIEQEYPKKAEQFLRLVRLEAFAFNKNISSDDILIDIINKIGLDGNKILEKSKQEGPTLLNQDIYTTERFNVEVFPTILMVNNQNRGIKISNIKSFKAYADTLFKLYNNKDHLIPLLLPDLNTILDKNYILFESEIRYLYNNSFDDFTNFLKDNLTEGTYTLQKILGYNYIKKI